MLRNALVAVGMTALIAGCGGGGGGGSTTPSHGTLIGIDVRPAQEPRYLAAGATLQFVARGNYSDGSVGLDLTGVTWSSNAPTVATVDNSGLVTGVSLGDATVTAQIGTISGRNSVGVTTPATGWSAVSAGYDHVLALKADGTLWSWCSDIGCGAHGQLGNGGWSDSFAPTQVGTDTDWSAISAGDRRSFALKSNGTLWGWGENNFGQVGTSSGDLFVPTQIGSDTQWRSVSTKWGHTLALKQDGTLWAWGYNLWTQLGISKAALGYVDYAVTPTQIGTATDWAMVSAGNTHSMGVKTDGTLWAWGTGEHGELGDGGSGQYHTFYSPTQLGTDTNWSRVAAGYWKTAAVKSDGSLYGWGYSYSSDGSPTALVPVRMGLESDWADVTQGYSYALASKSGGTVWSTREEVGYVGPAQQLGTASGWVSMTVGRPFSSLAINGSGVMASLDSTPAGPIVDIPANGTGIGPSPSVVAPQPQDSGGSGTSGALVGTWTNSKGSWTFQSSGVAVIDLISTNYGTNAHQITTMTYTSTATTVTYTITRAQLTCVCQYTYDETISNSDPKRGPFTVQYSINGSVLKIGTETFYKQ